MDTTNVTVNGECAAAAAIRLSSSGGEEPANTVVLGILMGIAGSVGVNVGQNIQKEENWGKAWNYFGLGVFISFAIVNFVAFGFAPASVLSPLEGTQFVSNYLWNYFVDKDEIIIANRVRMGIGTLLVIVGVALPILGSPGNVANFDEEALKCMWGGGLWLIFVAASVILAGGCTAGYLLNKPEGWPENGKKSYNRTIQFFYTVPSAVLGAFGVVNAKVVSELIDILFKDIRNGTWTLLFDYTRAWFLWVTVVLIIIGLGGWANRLNEGPNRFPKLTIIPLMNGAYILLSSTAGGLFFEEFEDFNAIGLVFYISGMAILLLGLVLIVPFVEDDEDVSMDDETSVVALQPKPVQRVAKVSVRVGAGVMGVLDVRKTARPPPRGFPALMVRT